jgi:hypothetical protein
MLAFIKRFLLHWEAGVTAASCTGSIIEVP